MKPTISYDQESEVLSIELSPESSVDSDVQGNVVIDYGEKGNAVRINIYKFNFDSFKKNESDLKQFAGLKSV